MLTLLYYCLKVIVCSGLLYGYYLLALRNNRFHYWNRYYLLAIILVSFTLPLLQIPLPFLQEDERPVVQSFRIIAAPDIYFSTLPPPEFIIDWPMIAGVLYGCIVLAFVLLFIKKIFGVLNLKKLYPEENLNGIHFYHTNEPATPFSFFKNIFWNNSISLSTEKGQQMLRHELTHVQENHSIDKVAMELLIAIAWWNPFLYYIRKELSVIHEFIADQKASSGNDALQYASLLLMKAMGSQQYALGNPFFHSQLKRRLTMLTTINNPKFSYLRRLLVLPLAVLAVALFSFKYTQEKKAAKQQKNAKSSTQENVESPLVVHGFYEDTTKKKKVLTVKEYKGSPIVTTTLTDDMKGVVVKTKNGKTYFLDRGQANEELGMKLSDNLGTMMNGTSSVHYDENGVLRAIYNREDYIPGQKLMPDGPVKIGIRYGGDSSQPLVILNGEISYEAFERLDANTIRNVNVWKGDKATEMYGDKGKNGVVEISTKDAFWDDALYIIDGKNGTKKDFESLFVLSTNNLNWRVDMIDGSQAVATYGEKGKNGVVVINTKLAKNEVTFPEGGNDISLAERVVIGHRIRKDSSAFPDDGKNNSLAEKVVTGYRIPKDSFAVKSQASPTLAKQLDNLGEVMVVGYGQKKYDAVFTKAEEPASFPGGKDGWRRHLERNLLYPEEAQKHNTQGTVRVKMTVDKEGNLYEIKALNDPGNGLAAEAERVIQKGPKWIPAKQNGKAVDYSFIQTITFQLQ